MRIIRGRFKTRYFKYPKSFPSRPTTDFAKEGLFNVLENEFSLFDLNILDLCAGTGNISYEFLSREAGTVTAIDSNFICVKHMNKLAKEFDCQAEINILKSDIFTYLEHCNEHFDIIFADPPFDFKEYPRIIELVFERDLLSENGMLVIEHGKETELSAITHFQKIRKYGGVCFSFFQKD